MRSLWAALVFGLLISAMAWSQDAPVPDSLLARFIDQELAYLSTEELLAWADSLGLDPPPGPDTVRMAIKDYYEKSGLATLMVVEASGGAEDEATGLDVEIVQAGGAAYDRSPLDGDTYLRLRGGARVRVVDLKAKVEHRISADLILVNQDQGVLSARGTVVYEKIMGASRESFQGTELFFDTETFETILLDGDAVISTSEGSAPQEVSLIKLYRTGNSITMLREVVLSSSVWDPPLYRIHAEKLFVLQENEWYLQSAVLYLGHIPVLYFPAFFHPGDSVVINPTVGYRDAEGSFIQTTTYLRGEKKPDQAFFDLLKISNPDAGVSNQKEVRGLFLRNTGMRQEPENPGSTRLLADYYAKLGYFVGLDYKPMAEGGSSLALFAGLGLTNNVYLSQGIYTPWYLGSGDNERVPSRTLVWGRPVPFRFFVDLAAKLELPQGSLALDFPWYSDPRAWSQFAQRSEDIDWSRTLGLVNEDRGGGTVAEKASLDWSTSFKGKDNLFTLGTGLSTLVLDQVQVALQWQKTTTPLSDPKETTAVDPAIRYHFAPTYLTLPRIKLTMGGSLALPTVKAPDLDPIPQDQLRRGEVEEPDPPPPGTTGSGTATLPPPDYRPPSTVAPGLSPAQDLQAKTTSLGPQLRLIWSGSPQFEYKTRIYEPYTTADLEKSYENQYRYQSLLLPFRLQTQGTYAPWGLEMGATWSLQAREDAIGSWNSELTESEKNAEAAKVYGQNRTRLDQTYQARWSPFPQGAWAGTYVGYQLSTLVFSRSLGTMDGTTPEYDITVVDWTPETVSQHQVRGELKHRQGVFTQTLALENRLAPLVPQWSLTYGGQADFPHGSLAIQAGARAREGQDLDWDSLNGQITLRALPNDNRHNLQASLQYDPDTGNFLRGETRAVVGPANASLLWTQNAYQSFDPDTQALVTEAGKSFKPDSLRFGLALAQDLPAGWKDRIAQKVVLNTSYSQSFVDLRNSVFTLGATYNLKIHRFLNLDVSYNSSNRKMYRYLPMAEDRLGIVPLSFWEDLGKSLNILDSQGLRETAFKLDSVSVGLDHYLGDWVLGLDYSTKPRENIIGNNRTFDWDHRFSFEVSWQPLPILSTGGSYKDRSFTVE